MDILVNHSKPKNIFQGYAFDMLILTQNKLGKYYLIICDPVKDIRSVAPGLNRALPGSMATDSTTILADDKRQHTEIVHLSPAVA